MSLKATFEAMERRILLSAYTFSQLGYFGTNSTGANPQSTLIADSKGDLFGTAFKGGRYAQGTVFEIAFGSNAIVPLASFKGSDGASPAGGLALDGAGDLFGTTYGGGINNQGTVFEVASGSNAITTLALFNGTNGKWPEGGVALDDSGNLYGATSWGGSSNHGTLFEIPSGTQSLTMLASFGGPDQISGGVTLDAEGDLFGTAGSIGTINLGSVFELARGSSTITTYAAFTKNTGAAVPQGGLTMDAEGNLYGSTYTGPANLGTIYEIPSGSRKITPLAKFDTTTAGELVAPPAVDAQGNVYALVDQDFNTRVVEIAYRSQYFRTLVIFSRTDGYHPLGGVTLDPAGNLYGLTSQGGAGDNGTAFEIAHGSFRLTVLASFDGLNGVLPNSVILDKSGNLFGATQNGGTNDLGAVFEVARGSNSVTTLASFNGKNGAHPNPITQDASGNLYGTTEGGGTGIGMGTVFEIASGSGVITTLASFNYGNGGYPRGGVILDRSGDLYGTTSAGFSLSNYGTIFEIGKGSDTVTTLASFDYRNGATPVGNLAVDTAGSLYGTTQEGGPGELGTVFMLASGSSVITTLATFNGDNGSIPEAGVILDSSGNLYGTASAGNTDSGSVFEIAAGTATLTTIASFNPPSGFGPNSLVLDRAGNLYGTTLGGGPGREGTAFEIGKGSTTVTTLMSFNGTNGRFPDAIAIDRLGNLYGATESGGPGQAGVVFELAANTAVKLSLYGGRNQAEAHESLAFVATISGGVPEGEIVTLLDSSNNDAVVATGTIRHGTARLLVPPGTFSVGTHTLIAVYGGDPSFAAGESQPIALTILPPTFRPAHGA